MQRITSFSVDHDFIVPGIYVSRIDGDVTTYDLRTRKPNCGDYMDNLTMHSVEHMLATFLRNSQLKDDIIYFGPMGCQTGFYLLVRNADNNIVLTTLIEALKNTETAPQMFGAERKECGNYKNLSIEAARAEAKKFRAELESRQQTFEYPTE
ncbi:MAG: S-ribosylhomocysteine lyase [Clostridia bacterium]|nr:S-ribosylhomocysteine lyase [Clostridia bacterium]